MATAAAPSEAAAICFACLRRAHGEIVDLRSGDVGRGVHLAHGLAHAGAGFLGLGDDAVGGAVELGHAAHHVVTGIAHAAGGAFRGGADILCLLTHGDAGAEDARGLAVGGLGELARALVEGDAGLDQVADGIRLGLLEPLLAGAQGGGGAADLLAGLGRGGDQPLAAVVKELAGALRFLPHLVGAEAQLGGDVAEMTRGLIGRRHQRVLLHAYLVANQVDLAGGAGGGGGELGAVLAHLDGGVGHALGAHLGGRAEALDLADDAGAGLLDALGGIR